MEYILLNLCLPMKASVYLYVWYAKLTEWFEWLFFAHVSQYTHPELLIVQITSELVDDVGLLQTNSALVYYMQNIVCAILWWASTKIQMTLGQLVGLIHGKSYANKNTKFQNPSVFLRWSEVH